MSISYILNNEALKFFLGCFVHRVDGKQGRKEEKEEDKEVGTERIDG